MADAEAAARAIVEIFATGDLDAIPFAVADDYVDQQGLGEIEIRGHEGFRPGRPGSRLLARSRGQLLD